MRVRISPRAPIATFLACLATSVAAHAADITVAVAANFVTTAEVVADAFTQATGHDVRLVQGSSGKLYAQITHGAPFDVFLSADAERPARLADDGLSGPAVTYAVGQLSIVAGLAAHASLEAVVDLDRIGIANPKTAPYGLATRQVLQSLRGDGWDQGVVYGENVSQVFGFAVTGNVQAAFVGPAQAAASHDLHVTQVPTDLHDPIHQDGVILTGADPAAGAFLDFLLSDRGQAIVEAAGYLRAPGS